MRAKPITCSGCPIESHGSDFTAVEGNCSLGVMVVAESSGQMEAKDGLPLRPYSPAGSVFERTIRRMGLDRQQLAVTNIIRCQPRGNKLDGELYEQSACAHCRPNLVEAIRRYQPKVIVAMGNIPLAYLTGMGGKKQSVGMMRGYVVPALPEYQTSAPVVVTLHPSFIRRGKSSYIGIYARDLQRAVNIRKGLDTSFELNVQAMIERGEHEYVLQPTVQEAWGLYNRVRDLGEGNLLTYDLETRESPDLDEDMIEEFADTAIIQAQFCWDDGRAIALPWTGDFIPIIQKFLKLPCAKAGHNRRRFDDRVLRAVSERDGQDYMPAGVLHDTMEMYRYWQPDLPANLQFASSFVQFPFPWKHLSGSNLAFYGCCDVDATRRLFGVINSSLERIGCWEAKEASGYVNQVVNVQDALTAMTNRGIAASADLAAQASERMVEQQRSVANKLDKLFPESERSVLPKAGYVRDPEGVKAAKLLWKQSINGYLFGVTQQPDNTPDALTEFIIQRTGLCQRVFKVPAIVDGQPVVREELRWCRVERFNPNSGQQIDAYCLWKQKELVKIHGKKTLAKAYATAKNYTREELEKLYAATGDEFFVGVLEYRELGERIKALGNLGLARDGRIHPVYGLALDTGIETKTPKIPLDNLEVLVPDDGCQIVEVRLGRLWLDALAECVGSEKFKQAVCSGMFDKGKMTDTTRVVIMAVLCGESDRAILDANRVLLGSKLKAVAEIRQKFLAAFPEVERWQQQVAQLAHQPPMRLVNRYGMVRHFYEVYAPDGRGGWRPGEQYKDAVSFLPDSESGARLRLLLRKLHESGAAERHGLFYADRERLIFNTNDREGLLATLQQP